LRAEWNTNKSHYENLGVNHHQEYDVLFPTRCDFPEETGNNPDYSARKFTDFKDSLGKNSLVDSLTGFNNIVAQKPGKYGMTEQGGRFQESLINFNLLQVPKKRLDVLNGLGFNQLAPPIHGSSLYEIFFPIAKPLTLKIADRL
jgi:hypothetical protein